MEMARIRIASPDRSNRVDRARPALFPRDNAESTTQSAPALREADGPIEPRIERIIGALAGLDTEHIFDGRVVIRVPRAANDGAWEVLAKLCHAIGAE